MDDIMRLMQKEEELHKDLRPYVVPDGPMGPFLNHPLIQELFCGDLKHCAVVNMRYEMKMKAVEEAQASEKWHTYVFLHERPWRFKALEKVIYKLGADQESSIRLIAAVWIDSENIWQNQKPWLKLWKSLPRSWATMDEQERLLLKNLPETFTVYRGIREPHMNAEGLSWTLKKETAEWFAKRYEGHKPTILAGEIQKRQIFAYFTGRNEHEVIINPRRVHNMRVL